MTTISHAAFQFSIAAGKSIVSVASWILGDAKNELRPVFVVIGIKHEGGRLDAVALSVENKLWTNSRTWYDAGAVLMVGSCQRAARFLVVIASSRHNKPWNAMECL